VDQNMPSSVDLLQSRLLKDSVPVRSTKCQGNGYNIEIVRGKLGEKQSKQKLYFDCKSDTETSFLDIGQTLLDTIELVRKPT